MDLSKFTQQERLNVVVNHAFGGWHHVGGKKPYGQTGVRLTYAGDFSTFDWTVMTRLVVACHVVRVRAEICQGGPGRTGVILTPREDNPNSWSEHHPDGDDLIKMINELKEKVAL